MGETQNRSEATVPATAKGNAVAGDALTPANGEAGSTGAPAAAGDGGATVGAPADAKGVASAGDGYREHPQTGTTPEPGADLDRPGRVDPSVLTDDRKNPDLLDFEKTWGHRLLSGLGYAMIVVALVLIIYCATKLPNFVSLAMGEGGTVTFGLVLYGIGLIAGIVVIPPAIVALWVSRRPKHATAAVVLGIVALVMVGAFIVYAAAIGTSAVTTAIYATLFALLPVLYLVAAIKIKRS